MGSPGALFPAKRVGDERAALLGFVQLVTSYPVPCSEKVLVQGESVKCGISFNDLFSLKPMVLIICVNGEEKAHY